MAVGPYVSGPTEVKVNLRDGTGMVLLGYSEDGVQTELIPMYRDIMSDRNGGTEGTPVRRQLMSQMARVRLSLTEFEPLVLRKLMHILPNDSANGPTDRKIGELPTPGCIIGDTDSFQLLLVGSKDDTEVTNDAPSGSGNFTADGAQTITPLNFLNCFYDGPIEINTASKNSMPTFDVLVHPTFSDSSGSGGSGDGVFRLYLERNSTAYNDLSTISIS